MTRALQQQQVLIDTAAHRGAAAPVRLCPWGHFGECPVDRFDQPGVLVRIIDRQPLPQLAGPDVGEQPQRVLVEMQEGAPAPIEYARSLLGQVGAPAQQRQQLVETVERRRTRVFHQPPVLASGAACACSRATMALTGTRRKPLAATVGSHCLSSAMVASWGWPIAMATPFRRAIASVWASSRATSGSVMK